MLEEFEEFITPVYPPDFRAGYVAIIGEPNVGKSTLMNALVGQKISIVSNKPQTTRHRILGLVSHEKEQMVFLDTPGLLKPKYALHSAMMNFAHEAVDDANVLLFMVDGSQADWKPGPEPTVAEEVVRNSGKPAFLAINKIDTVPKSKVDEMLLFFMGRFLFADVFRISALKGDGLADLTAACKNALPVHPPYYPLDTVSDQPEKFFVAEMIREQIFHKFRQEIPYSTTVDILEFKEIKGKKDLIRAEIFVERDSQKGILIGKKGAALKEIGELARKEIETFLGRKVFLELYVKVRQKWRDDEAWLNRLGYKK